LTTGGNYRYQLDEPGQEIEVIGRFRLSGTEKLELGVEIIHVAEGTTARVSLKATVDDAAQVVIKGNVIVEQTARKTESFLE
jgi:Fe-S cluster assembly scaffold protein SufB